MSSLQVRSDLAWAVMAMEASLVYPLAFVWLGGADGSAPPGPFVAVSMPALGFLAARYLPGLTLPGKPVWISGIAVAVGLRLLVAPPPEQGFGLLGLLPWVLAALVPAAIGLGLWWRGVILAQGEMFAETVRTEFTLIGAALLLIFGVYGHLAPIDASTRTVSILLFLCSGLLAVGLARQAAAGSPRGANSGALVAASVAAVLGLAGGLVLLLSPDVVSAIMAALHEVLLVATSLLLLPLALLFSWLGVELPQQELPVDRLPPVPELVEPFVLPGWLELVLAAIAVILIAAAALLAIAAVAWILWQLFQRLSLHLRRGRSSRATLQPDGALGEDAAALLAAFSAWALRLAGRGLLLLQPPPNERRVRDPRAAYRALLRWARRQGIERAAFETPREFQHRLAFSIPEGRPHYAALTGAYEVARYGAVVASEDEVARLRQSLAELIQVGDQVSSDS